MAVTITEFAFTSSPQSWVGQGRTVSVTPDDGYLFRLESTNPNLFSLRVYSPNSPFGPEWNPGSGQPYDYWTLQMKAPGADPLAAGLYEDALRYPFQGSTLPGLTLSGNHRGNNRNAGFFEVFDIGFAPDGAISMIDASFTQYGEQNESRWITGSVRYNYNPNPPTGGGGNTAVNDSGSTLGIFALALAGLGWISRGRLRLA